MSVTEIIAVITAAVTLVSAVIVIWRFKYELKKYKDEQETQQATMYEKNMSALNDRIEILVETYEREKDLWEQEKRAWGRERSRLNGEIKSLREMFSLIIANIADTGLCANAPTCKYRKKPLPDIMELNLTSQNNPRRAEVTD